MGKYTLFYMDVDMVVTTVTLIPPKAEVGGLGIQGWPWLYSEFVASLDYMRFC